MRSASNNNKTPGLDLENGVGENSINYWEAKGMYCRPASTSGFPVIIMPIGEINGLSIGIQIIGRPNEEEKLFNAANI